MMAHHYPYGTKFTTKCDIHFPDGTTLYAGSTVKNFFHHKASGDNVYVNAYGYEADLNCRQVFFFTSINHLLPLSPNHKQNQDTLKERFLLVAERWKALEKMEASRNNTTPPQAEESTDLKKQPSRDKNKLSLR